MSMYAEFLKIALEQAPRSDDKLTVEAALTVLLQRRNRLLGPKNESSSGIPSALSNELEYDTALIALPRLLDIPTDIRSFDVPQTERSRLELALLEKGIQIDEVDSVATDKFEPGQGASRI